MILTSIKRGATLQYEASVSNDAGLVDLSGWTITSQVRTAQGALVGSIDVTLLDQNVSKGQYRLRADTAGWPVGALTWDIRYAYSAGAAGQVTTFTETVRIVVEPPVTGQAP